MNRKLQFLMAAMVVAVAFGAVTDAVAQPWLFDEGRDARGLRIERLASWLDLTDDQAAELKKMWTDALPARAELHAKLINLEDALHRELRADEPDRAEVKRLVEERGGLQADLAMLKVDGLLAMHALLEPEQRKMLLSRRPFGDGDGKGPRERDCARLGRGSGWSRGDCGGCECCGSEARRPRGGRSGGRHHGI